MKTFKYIIAVILSIGVLLVAGVAAHFIKNPFIYMPLCFLYGWFAINPCVKVFLRWAEK